MHMEKNSITQNTEPHVMAYVLNLKKVEKRISYIHKK